jgi:hypothetical protein
LTHYQILASHFLLPIRGEQQIDITNSHHFPTIHQLQYQIDDIFNINKKATSTSIAPSRYQQMMIKANRSIEAAASHQLQVGTINNNRSESINRIKSVLQ